MGLFDMNRNGFDADASRYERENRVNPAEFAPGQGGGGSEPSFQQSDIFSTSIQPSNNQQAGSIFGNTGGGDIFSGGLGGGGLGGGLGGSLGGGLGAPSSNSFGFGMQQQQPQERPKDASDIMWDNLVAGFKGFKSFIKDLTGSFSQVTPMFWQKYGYRCTLTGVALIVGGVVGRIFGLDAGFKIAIGGSLSSATGVLLWFTNTEKARKCTSEYKDSNNTNTMMESSQDSMSSTFDSPIGFGSDGFGSDLGGMDSFSGFGSDLDNSDEGDEDIFGDDDDPEEEDEWGDYTPAESVPQVGMSADEAFNSLQEVPMGMYTRQYLWDMFTKVLPTMKLDFNTLVEVDEDDDAFLLWGDYLRDAATVSGCREDELPELMQLQENLFTIIVTCSRAKSLKTTAVADELANIYAYRDGKKDSNVFATADNIGTECRITIFNGTAAMISLKDMMLHDKDWILDSSNYMPVVLGVNQLGEIIHADFKKLESVIITGMPRSGKSWLVQGVLTQMCAFVPPSELNIYICDPKEGISDFKPFVLPHVKKFVSDDNKIVQTLRHLVKVEGPRRKKIIGDAGFVNIWDYKEKYPDTKLPIIYAVVDEIVTLASRMDKETNNEFRMLLRELISQLPALGIRAFLIPHVLNNDIIEKKTSDLVPCKISICGDADHIEKATGAKFKDFPYRLVNKGDMAVKLIGYSDVMYIHSPALTSSNPENKDLFDYMRRCWSKLEPSEVDGSIAVIAEEEKANQEILKKLESSSSDDLDIFGDDNNLSSLLDDDPLSNF